MVIDKENLLISNLYPNQVFVFSDQLIKQALNNIRTNPCGGNYENLEEILKQDPESLYMNWHICMYDEPPKRGSWITKESLEALGYRINEDLAF